MPDNLAKVNALTATLVRRVGSQVAQLDSFSDEMVVMEGLIAALIVSAAIRYNRQPDETVDAFHQGLKERVTKLVYEKKQ